MCRNLKRSMRKSNKVCKNEDKSGRIKKKKIDVIRELLYICANEQFTEIGVL